ncbi:hypothetical protein [Nonomuraea aurantiaca]|uniref:hypothetical protein n=1 Tax=Nonomuraea aurantiaca TaxID=2878562 RepID=UPI001CDA39D3|nr:hypothetical protein [Nonomuraea aurantiaca]MCA2223500.1 hypothetical protein [Nonomuraea aurantiaca]
MFPVQNVISSFRVPFVIGYTGDVVQQALKFVPRSGGWKLSYDAPRAGDWAYGVLRLRQNSKRSGRPDFTTVNTRRQWRCMSKRLCQVCARSAVDPDTGRISWLLSSEGGGYERDGFTNAPPTCKACIPEAITYCPHLRRNAMIVTVGDSIPYGVRADLFLPYLPPMVPYERNSIVLLSDPDREFALARELLVRLKDVRPARIERR